MHPLRFHFSRRRERLWTAATLPPTRGPSPQFKSLRHEGGQPNGFARITVACLTMLVLLPGQSTAAAPDGPPVAPSRIQSGPFRHNGAPVRVDRGKELRLTGPVSGAGNFTGDGVLVFDGSYRPGNSPAIVTLSPQVVFSSTNTLIMESGGFSPGPGTPTDNGYDRLVFTSALTPQVSWGGSLVVDLINGFSPPAGSSYTLFSFDAARDAGAFSNVTLTTSNGTLGPGLALDFSELYTTGRVRVGSQPGILGVTGQATSRTSIKLDASVNPNGANTVAWVEFGTSPGFGNQTANLTVGNGTLSVPFTQNATGLTANTTYFLRVRAQNAAGSIFSTPTLQINTLATRYQEWAFTELGNATAPQSGNHDLDAFTNLEEYALALFPPFPGALDPAGDVHTYAEGDRMRIRFWRHIDRDDITLVVQANNALTGNWTDLATSVHSGNFTGTGFVSENRAHPLSDPGLVEVRDTQNITADNRRFLRILILPDP